MSIRLSTAVTNAIAYGMGWGDVIKNSVIDVYSGSQPTSADDAATGTRLCKFTTSGGTLTAETRAACKCVIDNTGGSVDSILIGGTDILGGVVTTAGTAPANATAVVAAINANPKNLGFFATMGGGTAGTVTYGATTSGHFYIIAPKNSGTTFNAVTITLNTTTTKIDLNDTSGGVKVDPSGGFAAVSGDSTAGFTAGVNAANGLLMTYPAAAGLISKSGTWSDTSADASGTAGWFRILCTPNYDAGTTNLATTGNNAYLVMRIDGTVGTSGSDMTISSTSITAAAAQTVNQFDLTIA